MNNNEIKLTISVSDELLAKLLHAMQKPNTSGIPMQALLGMAMQPPPTKEPPQEKPTIGFKS
tara:strand:+ start:485 stop:670 length:186 start_codon:yes stop_codon:yes gene_type:complete